MNAAIVRGVEHSVEKGYLFYHAGYSRRLHKVTYFERLENHHHDAACQVGKRSLQRQCHGGASSTQHCDDRCHRHTENGHDGDYQNHIQQPFHCTVDKRAGVGFNFVQALDFVHQAENLFNGKLPYKPDHKGQKNLTYNRSAELSKGAHDVFLLL